ncbi:uncharacterized protein yc1106_07921 [Curvularia clavata]|uniref:Nuclear GTPase SLIP-GC n=1 Tax=Curvularia clavata TaxID=95742 RepID=A0A9Q9DVA6_CURCL|nr:uncharacterized protein yc1106_07921 [Curvularia clavata]
MDWDNFVQRARKLAPQHKAKPYLIGVLDHRKSMHDKLGKTDFYWFECSEETLAQRVREQYQKRTRVPSIQLHFKDTVVSDSDPVDSFTKPGDRFVVFAAVDPAQAEAQPSTSALQFRERSDTQVTQKRGRSHSASPSTKLRNCAGGTVPEVKQDGVKEETPSSFGETSLLSNDQILNTVTAFDSSTISKFSPAKNVQENLVPLDRQIGRVIDLQDADVLDAGVARSIQILENLKQTFSHHYTLGENAEVATWIKAMSKLFLQAEPKRTIIGVVGNTGAGKSSVINAILDEERLVPTNCMRACTAVVTEISWNSNASVSRYRAEIEFIGPEDWKKELSILMQELLSGNGTLSHEVQDPTSESGVAWAKFRAVYPSVAKSELQESIIPTLMSQTSVNSVLGTTKQISMDSAEEFYIALLEYVDSKEKLPEKDKNKGTDRINSSAPKPSLEIEYWPLIKVVKIYTTSSALSTGAVLVDLPGVHDSNAARAAVAQGYMKQCTGLWIVAPISRAVDDKSAKTLLGDSFKRQLKYDGGFSNVTFICSKTDNISIMEAIGSLRLEDEVGKLDEQGRNCNEQIEHAMREIEKLKELRNVRKVIITNASNDIETWETLQEQLEEGKRVYAPVTQPKRASADDERRKKRQAVEDDSDDEFFCTSRQSSSSEGEVELQSERVQLSESAIKKKLKELKATRKNAQHEGNESQYTIGLLKDHIRKLDAEKSRIKAEVSRICISGRNHYSKSAIQRDFAAGIRELDQENAAEADEDHIDPEEEIRDYEQVAKSLPVFCVSTRAYQKLCGRMQKDDDVAGFTTAEETEVPQLQDHCRKLTEAGRIQTSRSFLTDFYQLLIDLRLWTMDPTLKMTGEETQQQQLGFLEQMLRNLRSDFDKIVHDCIEEVQSEMNSRISGNLSELINAATEAAPETAYSWGQKKQGGLMWASYRAVIRHDGVYYSPIAGHRDFNLELVQPIMKPLTPIWDHVFHTYLPGAITKHVERLSKHPSQFHEAVETHAQMIGIRQTILSILSRKVPNYERRFKDLGICLVAQMNELQREANREFAPCIADAMRPGYNACAAAHGTGAFKQMKERMTDHVELARRTMFQKLAQKVDKRLNDMCERLRELIEANITEVCDQMSADYMVSSGGKACNQLTRQESKENQDLLSAVHRILESVDAQFEAIADRDIRSEDKAMQISVKGKEPNHDGNGKQGSTDGSAQESSEEEDHGNDNIDRFKLDELKSRLYGVTPRNQVYDEDDMSDSE